MKRFFRNNGLSIVLGMLFLGFWAAQAVAGWKVHNADELLHGGAALGFRAYLASAHFWQATGENWESEFLQMGAYVILTCFLYQKGSAESKDPDDPDGDDSCSKKPKRQQPFFYRNSLFFAFVLLFSGSFVIHAEGGLVESNEERAEHGQPAQTLAEFLEDSEFWFQSFQNWQSEFLAVFSIVVLSIFLRQDGSPESKSIDSPDSRTGK